MPFYRKKLTYDQIAPHAQRYRQWLRLHAYCVQEQTDSTPEVFLVREEGCNAIRTGEYSQIHSFLLTSRYLVAIPFDHDTIAIYFTEAADGPQPTVSKGFVRLPKLSHLITLTPTDFFLLLNIVATAKNTQSGDSLSLNPGACGITNIESSVLNPFFTKLRTNYRLNPDYADRKWTDRADIALMAEQFPSREAHLMAMQYFTANQNNDLFYFPMDTVIDLELDTAEWQQINDNYASPPGALNPTDIRR